MAGIAMYVPHKADEVEGTVTSAFGARLVVTGALADLEPSTSGDQRLARNPALVHNLWSFALHEKARRRARNVNKKASHEKQAEAHRKVAVHVADLLDQVTEGTRSGWCSSCFQHGTHQQLSKGFGRFKAFLCAGCGTPTLLCAAVRCTNFATRGMGAVRTARYCGEHRHDIPGFEKAAERISDLADYRSLLTYERRNLAKASRVGLISVLGAGAMALTAGAAAPAIGGAVGSLQVAGGYAGAAATSHGLALIGGGSVAAGGMGMAGGTAVVTAAGGALGGTLGAGVTAAYVGDDKSFKIEKVKEGIGVPVVLANGFLTEGTEGWAVWRSMVEQRYPDSPVYRVHWGSKELKTLSGIIGGGIGKRGALSAVAKAAARGGKQAAGKLGPVGAMVVAADVLKNPWHTAIVRADRTGVALAGLIARTDASEYVLVGHSLGARVVTTAAETLETMPASPRVADVHLLGAAIGSKGDRHQLSKGVSGSVFNYYSNNDKVLRFLYTTAQAGSTAVGLRGFRSHLPNIKDRNVSRTVAKHSDYFDRVRLV